MANYMLPGLMKPMGALSVLRLQSATKLSTHCLFQPPIPLCLSLFSLLGCPSYSPPPQTMLGRKSCDLWLQTGNIEWGREGGGGGSLDIFR